MEIKISDRVEEAKSRYIDIVAELNEYKMIQICVNAMAKYKASPEKYPSATENEINELISKFESLCNKHEIKIPEFIEWESIELT